MSDGAPHVVLCTVPDADTGTRLGRAVVEERLAACCNLIVGMRSIYRWHGEIKDEPEALLVIKAPADRLEALRARLVALHPYECPEVIALPIVDGYAPYLHWITAETR